MDLGAQALKTASAEANPFITQTIGWRSDVLSGKRAEDSAPPMPPAPTVVTKPAPTGTKPSTADAVRCPKCHLLCPPGSAVCPHCKYIIDSSMRRSSQQDRADDTASTLLYLGLIVYVIASIVSVIQLLPIIFGSYTILDWLFDSSAVIVIVCLALAALRVLEICGGFRAHSAISSGSSSPEDFSLLTRIITIEWILYGIAFIYLLILSLTTPPGYYRPGFMHPMALIGIIALVSLYFFFFRTELICLGESLQVPVNGLLILLFFAIGAVMIFFVEPSLSTILNGVSFLFFGISMCFHNKSVNM